LPAPPTEKNTPLEVTELPPPGTVEGEIDMGEKMKTSGKTVIGTGTVSMRLRVKWVQ